MARPKDKEGVILEAAFEVYSEKGFKTSSMQDIATRAGLGKGTLYEYFKTKDELFIAVVQDRAERGMHLAEKIVSSEKNAEEKLDALLALTQNFLEDSSFLFQAIIAGNLFGLGKESEKKLHENLIVTRNRSVEAYRKILEQGQKEGIVRTEGIDLYFVAELLAEAGVSHLHVQLLRNSFAQSLEKIDYVLYRQQLKDMIFNGVGNHQRRMV